MRAASFLPCGAALLLSMSAAASGSTTWDLRLATGLSTYTQTYALATEDTTEVVSDAALILSASGRSPRHTRHRWSLRPELSFGTDLTRQRLDFDYRLQPDSTHARVRVEGSWLGRRYRGGTDYSLSSDSREARTTARLYLDPSGAQVGEIRLLGGMLRYREPSRYEVDYNRVGAQAMLRSSVLSETRWSLATGIERRSYPDSTAIDRIVGHCEGEYDARDLLSGGVMLRHRSEYRTVRDERAKPGAWAHFSELAVQRSSPHGSLDLEVTSEIRRYRPASEVYFDSWRVGGWLGVGAGDPLALAWRVGPALEHLSADEAAEAYTQFGLRAELDSWSSRFDCSLSVEYGRRDYRREETHTVTSVDVVAVEEDIFWYSDFDYWDLWIMAGVGLSERVSLDLMVSFQPEKHTERADDSTVSFADLRLVVDF